MGDGSDHIIGFHIILINIPDIHNKETHKNNPRRSKPIFFLVTHFDSSLQR